MTLEVLFMRQFESSLRCPTFPAREPSPAIPAASPASSRGRAAARPGARHLYAPGTSLCAVRGSEPCAGEHTGGKGGIHREVAAQFDPTRAPHGPTTWGRDQRLGRRCVTACVDCRFHPWLTCRPRRDSRCGFKPSEIVWRRRKWPALTAYSCRPFGSLPIY